jgi:hypothetical protein
MKMRSMMEILNLVIDRHITTKQQAAAMVNEEAQAIMEHYHISAEEATRKHRLCDRLSLPRPGRPRDGVIRHRAPSFRKNPPLSGRGIPPREGICRA